MAFKKRKAEIEITAKNKTDRAFAAVRGDLSRIAGGVRSILGPVALLGAATGIAVFGRNTLKAADDIGKFADRIGLSTTKLQEYRHAFELAGVAQEETDKGLLTFSKRIGEARGNTGAMVTTLKAINPELLKMIVNSKSEGEALEILFRGLGKAKNAAEKNAIANATLGRAGTKMTDAFKEGSKAFFDATREANRLGLVIDEKLIRNAEQLNDDFTRASGIIGTQLSSAFLTLAPAITTSVQELVSFLTELNKIDEINSRLAQPTLENKFNEVSNELDELIKKQKNLRESQKAFADQVGGDTPQLKAVEKRIRLLERQKELLTKQIILNKKLKKSQSETPSGGSGSGGRIIAPLNELQLKQQFGFTKQREKDLLAIESRRLEVREQILRTGFSPAVQRRLGDIDSQFVGFDAESAKAKFLIEQRIINADQNFGGRNEKDIEGSKRVFKALADEKRALELLKDPLDEAARLHNILEDRFIAGKISGDEYVIAVKRLEEEFGLIPDNVDPVLAALDSIKSGLEVNVTDALFDAIKGVNSFGEASKQMVDLVIKEFIRLQAVQPILNGLFGKSGSGGGFIGSILPFLASLFGGPAGAAAGANAGALAGFAQGGSFQVGGPGGTDRTPVGFMASRGERVTVQTPAQQRQGNGTVIHIDARGSTNPSETEAAVMRAFKKVSPLIVNTAVNTVRKSRQEDPNFFG